MQVLVVWPHPHQQNIPIETLLQHLKLVLFAPPGNLLESCLNRMIIDTSLWTETVERSWQQVHGHGSRVGAWGWDMGAGLPKVGHGVGA